MPKDPVMLLSFVNTQLRDNYNTLEELCKSYMVSEEEITNKLKTINYEYNSEKNQFVQSENARPTRACQYVNLVGLFLHIKFCALLIYLLNHYFVTSVQVFFQLLQRIIVNQNQNYQQKTYTTSIIQ